MNNEFSKQNQVYLATGVVLKQLSNVLQKPCCRLMTLKARKWPQLA